jgi:hypothetical protein
MQQPARLCPTSFPKGLFFLFATWILATVVTFQLRAQDYPVRVTTILTPPYSIYLADYVSPDANAMQVILNLRDLDRPEYRVKLRISIEGQGITIRTRQGYVPPAIIMQGGVPLVLTGVDLRNYFNPDNLDFAGISKTEFTRRGALPEGFYTFRIEVLDYIRSLVVSNAGVASAWMILNDPPILNVPFNNDKLTATDPQNIMFSWTPRHTASPNAAFSSEYEFKMVELYPANRNPNDAIRAANTIFTQRLNSTALNYSIAEPLLIPGRKYAFRVRAVDVNGKDLFKNEGYSEVFVFQYGDDCVSPPALVAEALDPVRIKLSWETTQIHTRYSAQYRKKGNSSWIVEDIASNSLIIPGLQAGTQYEYQVKGICGTIQGAFTPVAVVETPQTAPNEFSCGTPPPAIPLNTEPFEGELQRGDAINSSDFEIALDSLKKNTDGSYAGTGFALMPWLKFASIRVKFRDIKINKEKRVFSGNIVTVYTKNSRFVASLDLAKEEMAEGVDGQVTLPDSLGALDAVILPVVQADIQDVRVDPTTSQIIVTTATGETIMLDRPRDAATNEIQDAVVTDANGDTWNVDRNGIVTQGPSTAGPPTVASRDAVNFNVNFLKADNQLYGFDPKTSALGQYDTIHVNGTAYNIAWKSVEANIQDVVTVHAQGQSAFPAAVGFKTLSGPVASQPSLAPDQKQLFVIGKAHGQTESLLAYASVQPAGQQQPTEVVLGKLNIASYNKVANHVYIVPVNGAATHSKFTNVNDIATKVNTIFRQAMAEWQVTLDPEFTIDPSMIAGMDAEEPNMFSSFNPKMKAFNRAFKNARGIDPNGYYVFVVKGAQSRRAGIMPFKRKFGYIFIENVNELSTAIAHELGHGAFRLQHTFEEYPATANEPTRNLMSYETGNPTELKKYQWDHVHHPQSMVSWLQDADESALVALATLDVGAFADPLDPRILQKIQENISAFNINMEDAPTKRFRGEKTRVAYGRKWNARWAFDQIDQMYPDFWSAENKAKILIGEIPTVDEKYLQTIGKGLSPGDFNKLREVAVIGKEIKHHHMNHGNFAVSLEGSVHTGAGNTKFWHNPKFRNVASRTIKSMSQITGKALLIIGFAISIQEVLSGDLSSAVSSMSGLPQNGIIEDVSISMIEEGLLSDTFEKVKIGLTLLEDERFTVNYWSADDLLAHLSGSEIAESFVTHTVDDQGARDYPYLIVKFEGEMVGIVNIPD